MSDEDEDLEHYFLQPVKGYNISEKIKLANEQLYELEIPYNKDKRPKVSFRDNLVEFEPDFSSDDGYGESGTSTSDHELKNNENTNRQEEVEEACDLELELENLKLCCTEEIQNESDMSENDESEVMDEQNGCDECGTSDEDIPDETECTCENDSEDDDDENDSCERNCSKNKIMQNIDMNCSECNVVEKVVAELIKRECELEEEEEQKSKQEVSEPPEVPQKKKKRPLYKFRGYIRNGNQGTPFEIIETEHGRFRGCCRHKTENIDGLPHYEGAYSLYGLSEEQYERREERLQYLEKKQLQKFEQLKEENQRKSVENEDAFEKWLKQKTKGRSSRNKNMYDFKPKPRRIKIKKGPQTSKVLDQETSNNSAETLS